MHEHLPRNRCYRFAGGVLSCEGSYDSQDLNATSMKRGTGPLIDLVKFLYSSAALSIIFFDLSKDFLLFADDHSQKREPQYSANVSTRSFTLMLLRCFGVGDGDCISNFRDPFSLATSVGPSWLFHLLWTHQYFLISMIPSLATFIFNESPEHRILW